MAININTVYKTVLLILNKEERGYVTPDEFNRISNQVQLEIFEQYSDDLNQQLRVPQSDTDYADRIANIDEKISIFKTFGGTTYNANVPSADIDNIRPGLSSSKCSANRNVTIDICITDINRIGFNRNSRNADFRSSVTAAVRANI